MYEYQKKKWVYCKNTECQAHGKEGDNAWKKCIKLQLSGSCKN